MGSQAASVGVASLPLLSYARRDWLIIVTVSALVTAIGVLGFTYAQAFSRRGALSLSIHEEAGQLIIAWASAAAAHGATLEIDDGAKHTRMLIASPLSDVTYSPRTADVQVRLTRFDDDSRPEIARFLVREPSLAELNAQFTALLADARALRLLVERQRRHVADLWAAAEDLEDQIPHRRILKPGSLTRPAANHPEVRFWR